MALKVILTQGEFDSLSDVLKAEYKVGDDGGYKLDTVSVNGYDVRNIDNLKSALEKERASRSELEGKLKGFGDMDPKAAASALKRMEELAGSDPKKEMAEQIKLREEQLIGRHNEAMADSMKERQRLELKLKDVLVTQKASAAILELGGSVPLLRHEVERHVRLKETTMADGSKDYAAEVFDPVTGVARIGGTEAQPMTIGQLVGELKNQDAFKPAFSGTGATGSGGTNGTGSPTKPVSQPGAVKTVSKSDPAAMSANIEGIAAGTVQVTD